MGFNGIPNLANQEVIELLNKISGKDRKSLNFEEFKKQINKINQKQVSQKVIQSLSSNDISNLANQEVIELLNKISEKPSKSSYLKHFEEFRTKVIKENNEIENKLISEEDFLDLTESKEMQILKTIQSLDYERTYNLSSEDIINFLKEIKEKTLNESDLKEFKSKVNQQIILTPEQQKHLPEILLKKKVIELGMEIKCDKCNKWSWYSLKRLNHSLVCDFCLKIYQFPFIDPILEKDKISEWSYRVVGPFALSRYAQGGYAVALSIHFFTEVIGRHNKRMGLISPFSELFTEKHSLDDKVTWSTGQEMTLTTGDEKEIDFIIWSQRLKDNRKNNPTEIIFGEAKSFSRFSKDDISKMQEFSKIFPDSFLVFATMRDADKLESGEKKNIKKLIESHSSVIILTGTELFTKDSLLKSWFKKGGIHKKLAVKVGDGVGKPITLKNLAQWTQQLYLQT